MPSQDDDVNMANLIDPPSSTTHSSNNETDAESICSAHSVANTTHKPSTTNLENAFLARVHGDAEIYECCVDNLLNLPPQTVLASATYKSDFHRAAQPFTGNYLYVSKDHQGEYETILIGEILPESKGTKLSAKGTHYPGTAAKPYHIDDKTKVKCALALTQPTMAPERLAILFDNQIATLTEVIDDDKNEVAQLGKDPTFKEWTSNQYGNMTHSHDIITVMTEPIYMVPQTAEKTVKNKKMKIEKREPQSNKHSSNEGLNADTAQNKHQTHAEHDQKTLNTTYDPHELSDYGGDMFRHEHSRLRQMDFRDEENNLIHPKDWYSAFRSGTFVLIRATLHAFIWDNRRVYQIIAHTVRILDKSPRPVEKRNQASMPVNAIPSTSSNQNSEASLALSGFKLGKRRRENKRDD